MSRDSQNIHIQVPETAPSFGQLLRVFAHIGCLSFGGPAGQISLMHRAVVEERRWMSEERFLHALNYCMLLPGPEAQQLATYIGWLLHGLRGGLAAGLLFILPGLAVMLGLSVAYGLYHETGWLQSLFFGLKAAVLAIVVEAVFRVGRRALKGRLHHGLAAVSFLALFVFGIPFPLVILAAALIGLVFARTTAVVTDELKEARPTPTMTRTLLSLVVWLAIWQAPLVLLLLVSGDAPAFADLFSFFSKMALVTFGGAYAVLAYVAQMAVDHYGWLRPGEMLDGLALAETTPGPLVLVLCFVGYLAGGRGGSGLDPVLAGTLGLLLTAWATFVPSFLWIFIGAPYVERLRANAYAAAALSAITAAVVGVILNLSLWFALHVLFGAVEKLEFGPAALPWPVWQSVDWKAAGLAALSAVLLLRLRWGVGRVLGLAAALGLALPQL
ncbi:MAG: chromate efflux transporter [Rhizobiales bacterium]|nr:chromate efflux transporter [Hyphomicrobiales bacterium]